jgi:hypothetical protein
MAAPMVSRSASWRAEPGVRAAGLERVATSLTGRGVRLWDSGGPSPSAAGASAAGVGAVARIPPLEVEVVRDPLAAPLTLAHHSVHSDIVTVSCDLQRPSAGQHAKALQGGCCHVFRPRVPVLRSQRAGVCAGAVWRATHAFPCCALRGAGAGVGWLDSQSRDGAHFPLFFGEALAGGTALDRRLTA